MRTLPLNSLFQARLFVDVSIVGLDENPYQFDCIVDTGCVNTLIDEEVIEVLNYIDLKFSQPIKIAGIAVSSRAIIIERCESHDQACLGMTEGAMIGTEAGDMLTACCKEPTHHLAIA